MPRNAISAVLFDLDGTLADTIQDIGHAVNRVLERHSLPQHSIDAYTCMVGNGFGALINLALPEVLRTDPSLFENVAREAKEEYAHSCLVATQPFPGITELLHELTLRKISLAVLSNKPDALTRKMTSILFPSTPFLAVRGEKVGFPRKPDPSAALDITRKAKIPARAWTFVGDSEVDMATARAGGMVPVGVSWGYRNKTQLIDAGARAVLESPFDLLTLL